MSTQQVCRRAQVGDAKVARLVSENLQDTDILLDDAPAVPAQEGPYQPGEQG